MNMPEPGLAPPHARYKDWGWAATPQPARGAFATDPDGVLAIRSLFVATYRHRRLIGGIVGAALLLGIAGIFLVTPRYRAVASVQIDQRTGKVLGTEEAEPTDGSAEADRSLQTQVDILNSRAVAIRVARDLHLFGSDAFLARMGVRASGADDAGRRDAVLGLLQRNLHVVLPRNSRVVSIGFDSRDPATAADVANSYARSFIYANLQRRFSASQYSRAFLRTQLDETKARLEGSERALIGYARGAGLIDASAGGGGAAGPRSLVTANLVDLNQAYAAARATRIQAEQRWQEARAASLLSLPEVLGNPAVQQLTQRRAELQGELEQMRQRLKIDHPTVQQQQAQIGALDRQIDQLAAGLLASVRNQFLIARRQEGALRATLATLKGQTLAEQDRGIRYNILKREVETNRELYDALLQRFKEVSAEAGITSNNISVVDIAEPPHRPIWPRPLVTLASALLAGCAAAAGIVFAREQLDDAIRVPTDVEEKLGLPLLGTVPRLPRRQTAAAALATPGSPLIEAHRSIHAALELATEHGLPASILVTSSRAGEGKSTTALALARDLAAAGKAVLLVDADLRRPSLHRMIGGDDRQGLSTVLARKDGPLDVIQRTDLPTLDFVASGPPSPDPGRLVNGGSLADAVAAWRQRYEIIVLDGPPLLALADAVRLAANVAATLFVVEADGAARGAAKLGLRRLAAANATVAGAVLTKFVAGQTGYADANYAYGSVAGGR